MKKLLKIILMDYGETFMDSIKAIIAGHHLELRVFEDKVVMDYAGLVSGLYPYDLAEFIDALLRIQEDLEYESDSSKN